METMTGVIIGRFQVPYLHSGHLHLIGTALRECDNVIILLGYKEGEEITERDPYTFFERRKMISRFFPQIRCLPLMDHNNDEKWSEQVDDTLSMSSDATLYYSRDSFIKQYSGSLPSKEVEELPGFSGTQLRKIINNGYKSSNTDGLL